MDRDTHTEGWVVYHDTQTTRGDPWRTYWFGPTHGWGATWTSDPDDYSVEKFRLRRQAEAAMRRIFGTSRLKGYGVCRLSEARAFYEKAS